MAAVMTTTRLDIPRQPGPAARARLAPVGVPRAAGRRVRVAAATYRRRRVAAVGLALAMVVLAGNAGVALGGPPLGAPGRRPPLTTSVVRRGDSLWTVATRLAPGADPRPIVDALEQARHGAPLLPGEIIVWPRR